jgi:hypothetical protein
MRKRLHLKGWSKKEIDHAERIFKKAENNKHPHMKKLEDSLYWFTLIIGILGTVTLSLLLIPIFMIGGAGWSYFLTGLFGLLLGLLIVMLVSGLHWLDRHHHIFMSLVIPVVALFNFFIVVTRVNAFNRAVGMPGYNDPLLTGLVYFVFFTLPYAAFLFFRGRR